MILRYNTFVFVERRKRMERNIKERVSQYVDENKVKEKLTQFFQEKIVNRKAMFIPITGVATFMLVGYAAAEDRKSVV